MFYKPEIFNLINRFIDVFEDSFAIANKVSSGTQNYIQSSGSDEDTSNDVINIKIDAPVIILSERNRLWIADLGTLNIRKDSIDRNPNRMTLLGITSTVLYFSTSNNTNITNLNDMIDNPTLYPTMIHTMNIIISNLSLSIQIYKTLVPKSNQQSIEIPTHGAKLKDKKVSTTNIILNPFKVDLIPHSLESFISVINEISRVTSRDMDRLERIRSKADMSVTSNIEYNNGYENWHKAEAHIYNEMVYVLTNKGKILYSDPISMYLDGAIERLDASYSKLSVTFRHKKIVFRSLSEGVGGQASNELGRHELNRRAAHEDKNYEAPDR